MPNLLQKKRQRMLEFLGKIKKKHKSDGKNAHCPRGNRKRTCNNEILFCLGRTRRKKDI